MNIIIIDDGMEYTHEDIKDSFVSMARLSFFLTTSEIFQTVINRTVTLTWVMFRSQKAGKMGDSRTFLFLPQLLDPEVNQFKKYG